MKCQSDESGTIQLVVVMPTNLILAEAAELHTVIRLLADRGLALRSTASVAHAMPTAIRLIESTTDDFDDVDAIVHDEVVVKAG